MKITGKIVIIALLLVVGVSVLGLYFTQKDSLKSVDSPGKKVTSQETTSEATTNSTPTVSSPLKTTDKTPPAAPVTSPLEKASQ